MKGNLHLDRLTSTKWAQAREMGKWGPGSGVGGRPGATEDIAESQKQ